MKVERVSSMEKIGYVNANQDILEKTAQQVWNNTLLLQLTTSQTNFVFKIESV